MQKINFAQCWYAPEQYDDVKAIMVDGDLLPLAYADWKAGAEQGENKGRSRGAAVVRVPFDPSEFRRFCLHFGMSFNSEACAKFAAAKVAQNDV